MSVGPWPPCSEQTHQVPSQDSGTPSPGPFATTIELRQNQAPVSAGPSFPTSCRDARIRDKRRPKRSRSRRFATIGEALNHYLS